MRYLDRLTDPEATPLRWLTDNLANATAFHATVGYLDRAGVNLIQGPLIDLLERGGEAHIVVDARNGQPRHGDLAWLLDLFAPYGARATVSLAQDAMALHAKVFVVRASNGKKSALVGSANLTGAGLTKNWESCIALDSEDDALKSVIAATEAWHRHPALTKVDLGVLAALAPTGFTGKSLPVGDTLGLVVDELTGASAPEKPALPSGFEYLDLLLGGLHPGEMIVVAGRPSMGKSTLGLDLIKTVSMRCGRPSLIMSFEMSRKEIVTRLLSAVGRIELNLLRQGRLTEDELKRLTKAKEIINDCPVFINDTCTPSIRHLADEVRRAVVEDGIELVVVDYVQQLHVDRRTDSRQHEMAEISRALKHLARELQVPIVAISQLSRASEMRPDKLPIMSDLRDSGSLEQDADIVILIHRPDYYNKHSPRCGEADLIVAKQRNGPTDTVTIAAQLHLSRFVDFASPDPRQATNIETSSP